MTDGQGNTRRTPRPLASIENAARSSTGRRTPTEARQEIIDTARAYLSEHGYRDFTIDKLMRGTKVGRSAFYAYFSGIHELAAVFIHEIALRIEAVPNGWFNQACDPIEGIRAMLRSGVAIWQTNGRLIRALEEASWQDEMLRAAFRDEIGLRVVRRVTEAIERDQAKGLIGPMNAREMSVALNRLNVVYLNDRFGNPLRKPRKDDGERVLEVLEQVWVGALYGHVPDLNAKRRRQPGKAPAKRRPRP
jgi:TetR/AcrR family transcriptional regulator, ethionamide resistance regulator